MSAPAFWQFRTRDWLWLCLLIASWMTWWADRQKDEPRTILPTWSLPVIQQIHDGRTATSPASSKIQNKLQNKSP